MARLAWAAVVVALAGCGDADFADRRFWTFETRPHGAPVLLRAATMPTTNVRVVPPPGSKRGEVWLGPTPFEGKQGAWVGDRVVFENTALCIQHEETIQFGEIWQEIAYQKVWLTGMVKVRGATGQVWCNDRFIGSSERWILIGTGTHTLELRSNGAAIKLPPVEILSKQETEVFVPRGR